MEQYKNIRIQDYTYNLPDDRIAKYPKANRDKSKLLYYNNDKIASLSFEQLPDLLDSTDMLFFNNAKVIQARLLFTKPTGAKIEIFCLKPYKPADYNLSFQSTNECEWECLVHNLKKWKNDKLTLNISVNNQNLTLEAEKIDKNENAVIIKFNWYLQNPESANKDVSFGEILENIGEMPIPPYLNRKSENDDKIRYQTVYAKQEGSVAAPTAGLHFTDSVFDKLRNKSIDLKHITLHVGAGTFRPVKSETIAEHDMHAEDFEISYDNIIELLNHRGRVVAVGTTTVRTLESLYWIGVKLLNKSNEAFKISQWEAYELAQDISAQDSLLAIKKYMETNKKTFLQASTEIIIVPGYKFRIIKALVTNFHQPQSTLLLLIAAILGDKWKDVYDYALANDFRFLSYGDSSLLNIT